MSTKIHPGDEIHIKGFIMNKLYIGGYIGKLGKKHHGKHTSVDNLPKGYPPEHRGKFSKLIRQLRKAGLIVTFPSNGETHVFAIHDVDLIETGVGLANEYLRSVGLPLLPEKLGLRFKKKKWFLIYPKEEKRDWIKIIAFLFSVVGLLLHVWNFYNVWYVPPRAELSILSSNFWYNLEDSNGDFVAHIEGIITNEGKRTTRLVEKEYHVIVDKDGINFDLQNVRPIFLSIDVDENILDPRGSTAFNLIFTIPGFNFVEHNVDQNNFEAFIFQINHDDGIGKLSNEKKIPISWCLAGKPSAIKVSCFSL